MQHSSFHSFVIIWISFFISMCLEAIPWPGLFDMLRPSWIFLFLAYWVLALPQRINICTAFILGIFWDVIIGSGLGVHALALSIVIYIIAFYYQLLRNMAIWQQATIFMLLSFLVKILVFWAENLFQNVAFNSQYLWGGVVNFILWPWLYLLLRRVRRRFALR